MTERQKRQPYFKTLTQDVAAQAGISPAEAALAIERVFDVIAWKVAQEDPICLGSITITPRRDPPRNISFNLDSASTQKKVFLIPSKTRWVAKINPKHSK